MLWIALHLPLLSLESFAATLPAPAASEPGGVDGAPIALTHAHHIVSANAAAGKLGVKAGLRRATALALAPDIVLGQADALRDAEALTSVAHAALAFTPSVTLEPPSHATAAAHTVLLEVQASLRYFGGRSALLRKLHAALAPLGHKVCCATAPTAQGAALLARMPRAPVGRHATDLPTLVRMLDAVPLWLLHAGQAHGERLQGMGLRTVLDLRGLPRSGLARRFGEPLLDELDRACGVRPDPRRCISLPEVFESRLELFARADTTEQVLHGASILLARLVAWSAARHAQVRRFTLHMQHEARHRHDARTPADSTLDIALAEPSRDPAHLLMLLRERLSRWQLDAPTLELRLTCSDLACKAPPSGELFPTARSEREGLTRLIERLQARLGREQVQRLTLVEDHRPECATALHTAQAACSPPRSQPSEAPQEKAGAHGSKPRRRVPAVSAPAAQGETRLGGLQRPVWLLPEPQALHEQHMRPMLDGRPLQMLCGPERIECGWWDAALAERDYFIAQAGDGALVWIYRVRRPMPACEAGWFLQGRFG